LAKDKAFPDALQGAATEKAGHGVDGGEDGAGGGALEEPPEEVGGQAEASDFVGVPDAKGPSAPGAGLSIAAKDALGADRFDFGRAVVKAAQEAMAQEGADDIAVRTGDELKPLSQRGAFLSAIAKPPHLAPASAKMVILPQWERGGVKAGYDK